MIENKGNKTKSQFFESSKMIKYHLQQWAKFDDGMSIRSWAKLMKLSPTYLSLVLSSKRLVSVGALNKISLALDLDTISKKNLLEARDRDWLKEKSILSTSDDSKEPSKSSAKYAKEVIDSSVLLKSWIHMALLDFTTCKGFTDDISVLAKYFDVSPTRIQQIITELISSGLLVRDQNQKLVKTHENLRVSVPRSSKAIRAFHLAMMKKAMETLNSHPSNSEVISKRLVNSYTVAVNEEQLPQVFERINAAFLAAVDDLKNGTCTTVYQMQIQILPLIVDPSKK